MNATDWIARVLDPGWNRVADGLGSADPLGFPGYASRAGSDGAVVAGSGTLAGFPAEVISFDFSELGGSLGLVAGERIARAFERAIDRRAGVVALTATGGARMQEGMVALAQMPKTIVARQALAKAALPFAAYLRDPTTGGVYASFAGFADVIWAEPGATIGFAGPRVAEAMSGAPLEAGSHTAEFALARGLVDGIVEPEGLRSALADFLDLTLGVDEPAPVAEPPAYSYQSTVGSDSGLIREGAPGARGTPPTAGSDAWAEVALARHPGRPTGADLARAMSAGLVLLRGDRAGTDDAGVLAALGRIAGRRVGIIAHDRRPLTPAAYRKTQRLVRMAGRFGLPLVCLVDTPGADPSSASEAGGIVRAIAGTYRDVLEHPAPTVAVVTGEGGSGGALAFACCDRLLVMEHAVFSVIAPEGAAAILRRDDLAGVARDLRLTAGDLVAMGFADGVIGEPGEGAHTDPVAAALAVGGTIPSALAGLGGVDPRPERLARWRGAGNRYLVEGRV